MLGEKWRPSLPTQGAQNAVWGEGGPQTHWEPFSLQDGQLQGQLPGPLSMWGLDSRGQSQ